MGKPNICTVHVSDTVMGLLKQDPIAFRALQFHLALPRSIRCLGDVDAAIARAYKTYYRDLARASKKLEMKINMLHDIGDNWEDFQPVKKKSIPFITHRYAPDVL